MIDHAPSLRRSLRTRTSIPRLLLLLALATTLSVSPVPASASNVPTVAPAVTAVSLRTNDLVYEASSGKLYASVPGTAGPMLGNRIVQIDPATGEVGPSIFVGSEPKQLAVSGNGEFLYVGLDGAAAVRRVHLPTFTAGLRFSLGSDPHNGPYFVDDVEVQPGNASTVAISRRNNGFIPDHEGIAIYVDGVKLPDETPDHTGSSIIEFGSSPGPLGLAEMRLFGGSDGFRRLRVTSTGVTTLDLTPGLVSGNVDIEFANDRIYATNGRVIDPNIPSLVGTFDVGSARAVEPDLDRGKVYFISPSSVPGDLAEYDLESLTLMDSYPIAGISGSASSLVATDNGNLAFRTTADQVFLVRFRPGGGGIVLPPGASESAIHGHAGLRR